MLKSKVVFLMVFAFALLSTADVSSEDVMFEFSSTNVDENPTVSIIVRERALKSENKKNIASSENHFTDASLRSMRVSQVELNELRQNKQIEVFPNRWHTVALDQSVSIVFSDQTSSEFVGNGQTVILLDSGVDASHSFLSGAIIQSAAACFSNDNNGAGSPPGGVSLCQNGVGSAIGVNSANPCDISISGCEHGTQMAGIIAGGSAAFNGVATGASVIPIQVFTQSNDEGVCGSAAVTPCIGALTSDIIRALEYVRTIVSSDNVAAVNVSFGSSALFQGRCDSNPEKAVIDQLVAQGVAVIASSGNDGSNLEMTSPACISSTISVASTNDADLASSFNNRNSELDFFAPGESINTSSLPVNTFESVDGTSAAAAHVAGAYAVLKSKNSQASVALLTQSLTSTGMPISQEFVTKPRINITAALANLDEPLSDGDICVPIKTSNGNVAVICI